MRVLVVEDNELVRAVLTEVLADAGMQVTDTADPNEALKLPDAVDPPSVLVTDVDLGCEVDGFDLAAAARRRWPCICIVLISGRPANIDGHCLHRLNRFLPKPFRGGELLRVIQEVTARAGT
jgi:CheY-like chemotaxis protein